MCRYFHNWTGNRVTCRDWFQLTLKEGLTVFRDQVSILDLLSVGGIFYVACLAVSPRNVFFTTTMRSLLANSALTHVKPPNKSCICDLTNSLLAAAQEFSSDMNSRPVKRIDDVSRLRTAQFTEDAGSMAHPIRPDSYIKMDNFYTLTVYEKGAEIVRLYRTLLGKDGFRCAVRFGMMSPCLQSPKNKPCCC